MLGLIILGIILLILLIVIVSNVKVVPQAHAYVIERLGTYHVTWSTGLHVKIPFIDKISKKVSLKEQVIDFPPRMEWIKRYLLINLKKQGNIAGLEIINNNYLFNIFNIWAIGLFFYAQNSHKLIFCVARMTDEDGRIERGRDVGNIIKT